MGNWHVRHPAVMLTDNHSVLSFLDSPPNECFSPDALDRDGTSPHLAQGVCGDISGCWEGTLWGSQPRCVWREASLSDSL